MALEITESPCCYFRLFPASHEYRSDLTGLVHLISTSSLYGSYFI
jgi:hypothetical protein